MTWDYDYYPEEQDLGYHPEEDDWHRDDWDDFGPNPEPPDDYDQPRESFWERIRFWWRFRVRREEPF